MTLVKICGITNFEDASYAELKGADFIGINFVSPTGRKEGSPRYILSYIPKPEEIRRDITSKLTRVRIFGVFVNENHEKIKRMVSVVGLDGLQLHGDESLNYCKSLKRSPDLEYVKI